MSLSLSLSLSFCQPMVCLKWCANWLLSALLKYSDSAVIQSAMFTLLGDGTRGWKLSRHDKFCYCSLIILPLRFTVGFRLELKLRRSNLGKSYRDLNLDIGSEMLIRWLRNANPESVPLLKLWILLVQKQLFSQRGKLYLPVLKLQAKILKAMCFVFDTLVVISIPCVGR